MPETTRDNFAAFDLRFTARSDGNVDHGKRWTDSHGTIELYAGRWDLHVIAYLVCGENGGYLEAARGSLYDIMVALGETVPGNVRLYPITEGEGTFTWNIGFPGNVVTARMEITRVYWEGKPYSRTYYLIVDGEPLLVGRKSITMPAGRYRVIIALINDLGEKAVASEILHVYRNMESVFAQVFEGYHFIGSPPELSLAEWLALLRVFAQNGGEYIIELSGDENISLAEATLPTDRTDLTIILRGVGAEPSNARLSTNGNLFNVGSGVTLVLDENVTLVGRSANGNGAENNHSPLVWLNLTHKIL
ncbi:MAG: hypothetical protein FWB78_08875 [Treponema sp.]|nr:hypothetical protein [Treponema sp.]